MTQPNGQSPSFASPALCDRFGRRLHYLRLSVTDRCNLRCAYCMPPGGIDKLGHSQVLSLEELARVARCAVALGVDKIRLTGGEPLLRRDLSVLLAQLDALTPRPDLRLTTNGVFLEPNLSMLAEHGVSTINVSLDTLRPEAYGSITGLGPVQGPLIFERVWRGIEAALADGRLQVKLNVVLLGGVNQDEIEAFADLTRTRRLAVRFIEYMPVGRSQPYDQERFMAADAVLERLSALGGLSPLPARAGDGPAVRYRLAGAPGELGVISAVSSHFCAACNRLRLSADGRLVPCLHSGESLELLPELRGGCSDQRLMELIRRAAAEKPRSHRGLAGGTPHCGLPMSRLGG